MYTTYRKSGYTSTTGRLRSLFQDIVVSKGKTIHITTDKLREPRSSLKIKMLCDQ
jgi:hypothetical protein